MGLMLIGLLLEVLVLNCTYREGVCMFNKICMFLFLTFLLSTSVFCYESYLFYGETDSTASKTVCELNFNNYHDYVIIISNRGGTGYDNPMKYTIKNYAVDGDSLYFSLGEEITIQPNSRDIHQIANGAYGRVGVYVSSEIADSVVSYDVSITFK